MTTPSHRARAQVIAHDLARGSLKQPVMSNSHFEELCCEAISHALAEAEAGVWEEVAKELERRRDHWDWGIDGVTGVVNWCRQQAKGK